MAAEWCNEYTIVGDEHTALCRGGAQIAAPRWPSIGTIIVNLGSLNRAEEIRHVI